MEPEPWEIADIYYENLDKQTGSKSAAEAQPKPLNDGLVCPAKEEGGICTAGNLDPSCHTCMTRYRNELLICRKCGWKGVKLKKTGCVTDADEWYVCPTCGAERDQIEKAH